MNMVTRRLTITFLVALAAIPLSIPAATPKPVKSKSAPLTPDQRAAQALMKPMSLRDKVAQLVIVVADGDVYSTESPDYEKYRHWVAICVSAGSSSTTHRNTAWCATPSLTPWRCS